MTVIKKALVSVTDKSGLVEFARGLARHGVDILSTGGTAAALRQGGLKITDVSDFTGFPNPGRPSQDPPPQIHGGILGMRDREEHRRTMAEHGIEPIDMVVVNLYAFEQTVARPGCTLEEAIENIDIGGAHPDPGRGQEQRPRGRGHRSGGL